MKKRVLVVILKVLNHGALYVGLGALLASTFFDRYHLSELWFGSMLAGGLSLTISFFAYGLRTKFDPDVIRDVAAFDDMIGGSATYLDRELTSIIYR